MKRPISDEPRYCKKNHIRVSRIVDTEWVRYLMHCEAIASCDQDDLDLVSEDVKQYVRTSIETIERSHQQVKNLVAGLNEEGRS
jgi:hypothetical protein